MLLPIQVALNCVCTVPVTWRRDKALLVYTFDTYCLVTFIPREDLPRVILTSNTDSFGSYFILQLLYRFFVAHLPRKTKKIVIPCTCVAPSVRGGSALMLSLLVIRYEDR